MEQAAIAEAAGARVIQSARGYGAACKAGSEAALPTSTILVYMDGDGSDMIADLPRLVAPIEAGEADFVIGSRMRGKREPGSMLGSQIFAAYFVSTLLAGLSRGELYRHGAFSSDTENVTGSVTYVRAYLWMESGDADSGSAEEASNSGDSGRLS